MKYIDENDEKWDISNEDDNVFSYSSRTDEIDDLIVNNKYVVETESIDSEIEVNEVEDNSNEDIIDEKNDDFNYSNVINEITNFKIDDSLNDTVKNQDSKMKSAKVEVKAENDIEIPGFLENSKSMEFFSEKDFKEKKKSNRETTVDKKAIINIARTVFGIFAGIVALVFIFVSMSGKIYYDTELLKDRNFNEYSVSYQVEKKIHDYRVDASFYKKEKKVVEKGDIVDVTWSVYVNGDYYGYLSTFYTEKIQIGGDYLIRDIEEELIGMDVGDTIEVKFTAITNNVEEQIKVYIRVGKICEIASDEELIKYYNERNDTNFSTIEEIKKEIEQEIIEENK